MTPALASASVDADIVVVGAGVAGLAAAAMLRRAGKSVVLLEASGRIGGRAWTSCPPELGFAPFDHGAQWLHSAHRNPLVDVARRHGEAVGPDIGWQDRVTVLDGTAGPNATKQCFAAWDRWRAAVIARRDGPDISLADAADAVADDPWTATIETWEGAIIMAADADALSLHDWADNELDGENFVTPGGLGAMLARCLAAETGDIALSTQVHSITATHDGVRIATSAGDLNASHAIVTVSTGVLRNGAINFNPALPETTRTALDGLPMGLLTKIALRAAGPGRLGVKPGGDVFRRVEQRGAPGMGTIFWPGGSDIAVGFVGGRTAWGFAHKANDAEAFMREDLARTFGPNAAHTFTPESLVTDWAENPFFQGAYAYARPGHATARATLAKPVWEGRLYFAGEACAPNGLAGTVAGAHHSGQDAARSLLRKQG